MDSQTVMEVLGELEKLYPQAGAELNFTNPFETVIATVLAAQCTDKRVNIVTAKLFPKYPDAKAMAQLTPEELEPMIQECGLFHTKARNIVELCRILVAKYDGRVPDTMEELVRPARRGAQDGQRSAGQRVWQARLRGRYARIPRVQSNRPCTREQR